MLKRRRRKPEDLRPVKMLIEMHLEPLSTRGESTTPGELYAATGLHPAVRKDRQHLGRALRELDSDRNANALLPLCIWIGRTDKVPRMVRFVLVDLGYLGANEPAGPVVARWRDLSKQLSCPV